jgi:hypothetical protein
LQVLIVAVKTIIARRQRETDKRGERKLQSKNQEPEKQMIIGGVIFAKYEDGKSSLVKTAKQRGRIIIFY